ncbi:hypothetical protein C8R44DRAFT_804811 [Mycena epipterygia]|nr:hypothetical protein C8R44DRAFT_804811 [Mycena epipterygia]
MFILPAQSLVLSAATPAAYPWLAPLALLASVLLLALARAVLLRPCPPLALPLAVAEKQRLPVRVKTTGLALLAWLLPLRLSWETLQLGLPLMTQLKDEKTTPAPVEAKAPAPPRGRITAAVSRPEPARAARPRIEAPLPAIYESQTPVSMAKMIMSRHTYRAPARPRSPPRC